LIPRYPRSATVAELRQQLAARGYDVTARTLQRDLADKLARVFPISCDDAVPPYRWSFDRHAHINLPAVDPAAALALHLSEAHLARLLPPGVLQALAPQFAEAGKLLSGSEAGLGTWARRVRAVPLGPVTTPAAVAPGVWQAIADALLGNRQLRVDYFSRSKGVAREMQLHPQGLASRGAVTYLIGCVDGYDDLRHFALHRMQSAEALVAPARDCGFDIDTYLPTAAFAPRHASEPVRLTAHVHPQLAWSLKELPLGEDQRLSAMPGSEWECLEVSVADDEETFRWIRAQGPDVRIVEPVRWRERLAAEARELLAPTATHDPNSNQPGKFKHVVSSLR
jgi:predicted DNA-binding transcriptional regulator YafY